MREVKIEEYWPLIVKGTEEFGQIAVAENPEFNELSRCVYQVLKDSFLLAGEEEHAGEYGVSRWEKMLGLSHSADMSLDERKAAILTYLSVKLPYTWRVLKQMITGLLGDGNFELTFDNDAQKITIALGLSTTQSQIESVNTLISRVVPQNLEIEMAWVNGLPLAYTPVEYLYSTGQQGILLQYAFDRNTGIEVVGRMESTNTTSIGVCIVLPNERRVSCLYFRSNKNTHSTEEYGSAYNGTGVTINNLGKKSISRYNWLNDKTLYIDNGERSTSIYNDKYVNSYTSKIIGVLVWENLAYYMGTVYSVKVSQLDKEAVNLIPALDPTGAPCLYDLVTGEAYYNTGTGDFIYPTDAEPVMPLDLDEKFYAKRTEHGIRRLYQVPKGYTGTKDEYAAEHGFKELVEPPMPLEGYWTPEWRETDTQLILEWVETEPPMEVTEND